jgi:hypothetical protein
LFGVARLDSEEEKGFFERLLQRLPYEPISKWTTPNLLARLRPFEVCGEAGIPLWKRLAFLFDCRTDIADTCCAELTDPRYKEIVASAVKQTEPEWAARLGKTLRVAL